MVVDLALGQVIASRWCAAGILPIKYQVDNIVLSMVNGAYSVHYEERMMDFASLGLRDLLECIGIGGRR